MTSGNETTRELEFHNMQQGIRGRHPSIYLDEEENRQAERRRAIFEQREPDYENASPSVGTVLVTKNQRVDNAGFSNVSVDGLENWAESSSTPVQTLPVDFGGGEQVIDRTQEVQREREEEEGAREVLAADDERNTNTARVNLGSGATPPPGAPAATESEAGPQANTNVPDSGSDDDELL